ncbi:hypothetical protein [uncultured Flavobacterium sp.]|uniref:hypothetical protein n=1 Tax=uncultured Flavobacterium sp. TaxID=165435 RepID=UPI0025F1DD38|nr:hypothetical protein [uncultured Flavobacterium sp.]
MKNLFLTALMLFSVVSFAQSKFIEVEVTDTISLKPLSFQCNIYVDAYSALDTMVVEIEEDYDPIAEQEKQKNKLKEIKRKLESRKYKVDPPGQSKGMLDFKIYGGVTENGCSVVVNSEAEVEKIKTLLENDARVDVFVLKYADEVKAEEQLIKKLMDRAKAKVLVIGVSAGLRPGKIMEVREGKQGGGIDYESYLTQIMKMSGIGSNSGNYAGSLSKTFVVKFAAE